MRALHSETPSREIDNECDLIGDPDLPHRVRELAACPPGELGVASTDPSSIASPERPLRRRQPLAPAAHMTLRDLVLLRRVHRRRIRDRLSLLVPARDDGSPRAQPAGVAWNVSRRFAFAPCAS